MSDVKNEKKYIFVVNKVAKDLFTPKYKPRVVKDKKKYSRKIRSGHG